MAADDRVSVKTYVPRYQKEVWMDHAEELGMSQSEFVRTMVQAGRSGFEVPATGASDPSAEESADSSDLRDRVLGAIEREGPLDWDELVGVLTDGFETELEGALEELQASNEIAHRGREGGYVVVGDGN